MSDFFPSTLSMAERLKAVRVARGLSRAEAERRSGRGARWLERYEQGQTVPTESVLQDLSALYGVHPAVLRYGSDAVSGVPASVLAAADQLETASRQLADLALQLRRLPKGVQALVTQDLPVVTPSAPRDDDPVEAPRARQGLAR